MKKLTQTLSALLALLLCLSLVGCGSTPQTPIDDRASSGEVSSDVRVSDADEMSSVDEASEAIPKEETSENQDGGEHGNILITHTFHDFKEIAAAYAAMQKGEASFEQYKATTTAGIYNIENVEEAREMFDGIGRATIPILDAESGVRMTLIEYVVERNWLAFFYRANENDSMFRIVVYLDPEDYDYYPESGPLISETGEEISFQIYDLNNDGRSYTHTAVVRTEDYCFFVSTRADFPDGAEGLARVMEKVHLTTILEQIGE